MSESQIKMSLDGGDSEEEVEFETPRPMSNSSINVFEECPKKWAFRYILKEPQVDKSFFSFGTSMHSVLEYFYKVYSLGKYPEVKDLLEFYQENWKSLGYDSAVQESEYKTKGVGIIEKYHAQHLKERDDPEKAHIAFKIEEKFDVVFGGAKFTGFIDRLDKLSDGTLEVIDYKTGKALTQSRVAKDNQLTIYQVACRKKFGMDAGRLTFYHLNDLKAWTSGPRTVEQVGELEVKVRAIASEIDKNCKGKLALLSAFSRGPNAEHEEDVLSAVAEVFDRFLPLPQERKCDWCDYKSDCVVFDQNKTGKYLVKKFFSAQPGRKEAAMPSEGKAGSVQSDKKLAKLIDKFGKMKEDIREREEKADEVKEAILAALQAKKFVRFVGQDYEVSAHFDKRWEFKDKKKVLAAIERAGFWDRIITPSAPAVQSLMKDPNLPLALRDTLQKLGTEVAHHVLRVKKSVVEDG